MDLVTTLDVLVSSCLKWIIVSYGRDLHFTSSPELSKEPVP